MEEKVLIKSYCPSTKKLMTVLLIIGAIVSMLAFFVTWSANKDTYDMYLETYEDHQDAGRCGRTYSRGELCWRCEYVEESNPLADAILPSLSLLIGFVLLGLLIKLLLSSFSLTVTDKRVFCKVLWIHHVCLPIDFITAVARVSIFNILTISSPSGLIMVWFVINSKSIYNVLNDLIVARQQKPVAVAAPVAPVAPVEPVATIEE